MSNIAEHYINLIPTADWMQLLNLSVEKENYINNIIENDNGPRRKKMACKAYIRFVETVIKRDLPLPMAA